MPSKAAIQRIERLLAKYPKPTFTQHDLCPRCKQRYALTNMLTLTDHVFQCACRCHEAAFNGDTGIADYEDDDA